MFADTLRNRWNRLFRSHKPTHQKSAETERVEASLDAVFAAIQVAAAKRPDRLDRHS
jgi:hypothetical protein